ncbi:MAG: ATP phosphoribosyltransferase, partial [SAR202 cluster bacterium]|nr:ATP phosphoribosyltransferase [SAR202 cluster bacterium]
ACLVGRGFRSGEDDAQMERARSLTDMIEAHLAAREFYSVTANMKGETAEDVAGYVLDHADISGLRGPTISKVYTRDAEGWFAVTVIVEQSRLLAAVEQIRSVGGTSVTVSQPNYVFDSSHKAHERLTSNGAQR